MKCLVCLLKAYVSSWNYVIQKSTSRLMKGWNVVLLDQVPGVNFCHLSGAE